MSEFAPIFHVSDIDGKSGFRLDGPANSYSGNAVASVGDVNGDGRLDLLIGAETNRGAYLVLGTIANPAVRSISDMVIAGSAYFFLGEQSGDHTGCSVSSVGDVNGDGLNDLLIGAYQASPDGALSAGASYLVFGGAANLEALDLLSGDDNTISLADIDGSNGFRLDGNRTGDKAGFSVAGGNDVNGDGFADLIVGAPRAELTYGTDNGVSYIVFGGSHLASIDRADGKEDGRLDLTRIVSGDGAIIAGSTGTAAGDSSGTCVAGAGDVNGDGFDDALIVAPNADPNSGGANDNEGAVYLIFGRFDGAGFSVPLNLGSDGTLDFVRFDGDPLIYDSLVSAGSAGDINADGLADMVFGTTAAIGSAYVVFGKRLFADRTELSSLNGSNGFRIDGLRQTDFVGNWVSSAGDVNGDGFDDLLIAAGDFDRIDARDVGAAYVIFGKAGGFASSLDLGALNGNDGFRIEGTFANNALGGGAGVAAAGDINGDGFDDLMVGAYLAQYGASGSGSTYVIYGHRANTAVVRIGTESANVMNGGKEDDALSGRSGNDKLIGWEGDDKLDGESGNDTLNGGTQDDLAIGSGGNDTFLASGGDDTVQGGSGVDTLDFISVSTIAINANLATGLIDFANQAGSIIAGNIERIFSGNAADVVIGNNRANLLVGRAGNDSMDGAAGADTLTGGAGRDTLVGGADADRYDFNSIAESGITAASRDRIAGFAINSDKIDLATIDAIQGGVNNAFTFKGTAAFTAAGQVHVIQSGADVIVELNTVGASGAEMSILLTGVTATTLDALDFVL